MTTVTEPPRRRTRRRPFALAAVASPLLFVVALSACGDDGDTFAPPDVTIGPTSYQTLPVASTTTTVAGSAGTGVPGETVAGTQEYEVQSGDALSAIANRYEVEMQAICSVNNWTDCLDHSLQPGDVIRIPPGAIVPVEEDETEDTEADVPGTNDDGESLCPNGAVQGTYEIVDGDFQGRVATKTDFTLDQLEEANANNSAWNTFIVGQTLLLPCDTDEAD